MTLCSHIAAFDLLEEDFSVCEVLLRLRQPTLREGAQLQAPIQFNLCASVNRPGWRISPWPGNLNYFQIIKARKRGFAGDEVEGNRQKATVISLEQITSISAPETGGNPPNRELRRVRDRAAPGEEKERERRWAEPRDPSNFLEVNYTPSHTPANYISWVGVLKWFCFIHICKMDFSFLR